MQTVMNIVCHTQEYKLYFLMEQRVREFFLPTEPMEEHRIGRLW